MNSILQIAGPSVSMIVFIATVFTAILSMALVFYIILYQRKVYRHHQEINELRAQYNEALLQSRLEIQEQTLDHIAKELHANFSHLVSLININLSEIMIKGTDATQDSIMETKSLAKQLMVELKQLSHSLNTDHVLGIGFLKALENEITRLSKISRFKISFSKTGEEQPLRPEFQLILFRLCQEIFNNILKHSLAHTIVVSINYTQENMVIVIADDGIGFDVQSALDRRGGTGLPNIFSRGKLMNADVMIDSTPGKGARFRITIPFS